MLNTKLENKTTEHLKKMVELYPGDYTEEAIQIAKTILAQRGVKLKSRCFYPFIELCVALLFLFAGMYLTNISEKTGYLALSGLLLIIVGGVFSLRGLYFFIIYKRKENHIAGKDLE